MSLRRDVWWALRDADIVSRPLDSPVIQQKVLYLLGPIANQVHEGGIEAAVERETLEHWSQQATSRNLLDIRERLKRFMKVPPPISLKRKRDDNPVEASVMAILRAKMPDLRIEGDFLDSFPVILEKWVAFAFSNSRQPRTNHSLQAAREHTRYRVRFGAMRRTPRSSPSRDC